MSQPTYMSWKHLKKSYRYGLAQLSRFYGRSYCLMSKACLRRLPIICLLPIVLGGGVNIKWLCPLVIEFYLWIDSLTIQIVAYLISFMEDVRPLVRSISCWTLSRYRKWIVQVYYKLKVGRARLRALSFSELLNIIIEESFDAGALQFIFRYFH